MEGAPDGHADAPSAGPIAGSLRKGDVVSMVGWDTENAVKLAGPRRHRRRRPRRSPPCDDLAAGGGTDLNGGLNAGYDLAHKQFDQTRINRVVLISDGGANAGITDIETISGGAGDQDKDGIYLVGVGVGEGSYYNDAADGRRHRRRPRRLAVHPQRGRGREDVRRALRETMHVAARDVQVRLDMPPGFKIVKFSGEEYSADPAEIEPQHLAPNDAMVFHQTVSTCAPELSRRDLRDHGHRPLPRRAQLRGQGGQQQPQDRRAVAKPQPQLDKGAAVFPTPSPSSSPRQPRHRRPGRSPPPSKARPHPPSPPPRPATPATTTSPRSATPPAASARASAPSTCRSSTTPPRTTSSSPATWSRPRRCGSAAATATPI
jgi:hypothetical protein